VTIHDVAARAGVSVATVSRVLNGKELVRQETTEHVLAAAKALRYVPNIAARTLSNRRSQTLGIVLPDVHGEFFSEVIRGIDVAARREGYHILVSGSHSDANEMMAVVEAMRGRVDGLVVMAPDVALTSLGDALAPGLPVVLLNSADDEHDAITIDNYGGARSMMKHLASLRHKRIAFIKGPSQNADARERFRGYRQAMRSMRPVVAGLEFDGDFTERSGHAAGNVIADLNPRPTAIFAANDSMAVGALSAMTERGIAVPGEMTVVGFDDIPIAHYVNPPLTTIRVDIAELGRRSFALLRESIDETARPSRHTRRQECISTTLVVRKSCGVPQTTSKTSAQPQRKQRGRRKGEEL
jgi:LacI family transcriptional regulator